MLHILHYPKCDTCRKALNYLKDKGIEFEARDIKETPPSQAELADWLGRSGLPVKKFFNTSGQIYKALGLKDKVADMSEEEAIALLASDGMLVKRPILLAGEKVLVGFKKEEWEGRL